MKLNGIKKYMNYIHKYDIFMALIFTLIMVLSPSNSIIKGLVVSIGFFIAIVILGFYIPKIEKKMYFILGFTLPIDLVMYSELDVTILNLAGSDNFFVLKFSDLLIIFLLIYYLCTRRNLNLKRKNMGVIFLPLLYLLINVMSCFIALNKVTAIYETIRVVKGLLLFLIIVSYFKKPLYEFLIKGVGYGMLFQLIVGIAQIINGGAIGLQFLGEAHGDGVFRAVVTGLEKGMSGTTTHPGTLALYGIFSLAVIIFCDMKNKKEKYFLVFISIITVVLTYARTSIALMLFVLGIAILSKVNMNILVEKIKAFRVNKKSIGIILVVIAIICGGIFLSRNIITSVFGRFTSSDMSWQAKSRFEHIDIGLTVYSKREAFAYGANNYMYGVKECYPNNYSRDIFNYVQPVHNIYVLYLVEIGIIGLIVYILLYGKVILGLLSRKKVDNISKSIICSTAIWTIVIMIYNLTGWSGAKDIFMQIMWIVLGLNSFVLLKK